MNKEQAIKLFEGLMKDTEKAKKSWGTGDTGYYTSEALISAYNLAISVVKVMDAEEEPKQDKPVVKPFVAEWYEDNKDSLEANIYSISINIWEKGSRTDFEKWFNDCDTKPVETLIKMKLFGYTVKPKRWVVKFEQYNEQFYFMNWIDLYSMEPVGYAKKDMGSVMKFTDLKKAEAVATLIDGSVEEV